LRRSNKPDPIAGYKAALEFVGGLVKAPDPALTLEADVLETGTGLVATTAEPWLRVGPHRALRPGNLVAITYRSSFWDEPVRPVFRFHCGDGTAYNRIAPGAVAGAAIFKTRIPRGTTAISVSPTCRIGRFDFEITAVRRLSFVGELFRAVLGKPRQVRSAILTRMIGWNDESDVNLAWASAAMPITRYEEWRRARSRAVDLRSIDAPRCDWASAIELRLFVDAETTQPADLAATLASLQAQVFHRWRLGVVVPPDLLQRDAPTSSPRLRARDGVADPLSTFSRPATPGLGALADDPRVDRLDREGLAACVGAGGRGVLVAAVAPGARFTPYALGAIAEVAARRPEARVLYGDEELCGDDGRLVPVFKPGWSPLLEARRPYLGAAVFVRGDLLAGWTDDERTAFMSRARVPPSAAARLDTAEVASLRRVLLTGPCALARRDHDDPDELEHLPAERLPVRSSISLFRTLGIDTKLRQDKTLDPTSESAGSEAALEPEAAAATAPIVRLPDNPSALIVIPTRDQAARLGRCIASIFEKTAFANFSVVIIDNDSVAPEMTRLLAYFRGDKNVSVLRCPGPFNFSALCNAAAARRRSDVLVFLNDDTEVVSTDWLGRLVAATLQRDVGAVGGLLLYPDRSIQHAGVMLGMGNTAGHFGAGAPEAAPGWLSRNEVVHEVSAVTGACLAVARRKFMLVGGFDAEHLPVELSDIDLCLRLAEKGWRTRIDPQVRLVHAESASRGGATLRRLHVYAEQRDWLHARWLHVLRDDPYYHPGLSLYDREEALG
jgi:GT2 family glycosyltransferase